MEAGETLAKDLVFKRDFDFIMFLGNLEIAYFKCTLFDKRFLSCLASVIDYR